MGSSCRAKERIFNGEAKGPTREEDRMSEGHEQAQTASLRSLPAVFLRGPRFPPFLFLQPPKVAVSMQTPSKLQPFEGELQ